MSARARRPYAPEEDAALLAWRKEGLSYAEMDRRQGRGRSSARQRLTILERLRTKLNAPAVPGPGPVPGPVPGAGPRRCLCCGETFASQGAHNRLCADCRRQGDPGDRWRYA